MFMFGNTMKPLFMLVLQNLAGVLTRLMLADVTGFVNKNLQKLAQKMS
jgi:hypothetical protein